MKVFLQIFLFSILIIISFFFYKKYFTKQEIVEEINVEKNIIKNVPVEKNIIKNVPVGIPIEDNGVRETDEQYRELIDETILHLLRTYGHRCKNVIMLKGSTQERIEKILDSIRN